MKKWVLVLGANSDIALATSRKFAQEGWNIYLASRNMDNLAKEVANLRVRFNVEAKQLYFDAVDFNSHREFYDQIN